MRYGLMPRLDPEDRERLRLISQAGGKIHIVTARGGERFPDQVALVRWANAMCDADYMRLVERGGAHDPFAEHFSDFILTAKAERAAKLA